MENKICKQCRKWLANEYGPTVELDPWEHCHHEGEIDYQKPWREAAKIMANWPGDLEEPPEKPKEPCWCENDVRMTKIWGQIGNINKGWDILYCPSCGKKL